MLVFTSSKFPSPTSLISTTKPIDIHIKNAKQKKELIVQKEELVSTAAPELVVKGLDKLYIGIALFVGIVIGILIMLGRPLISFKTQEKLDIKDTKMLLVKLMPYKEDKEVSKIIAILEGNLYANEKVELDKKVLKVFIKKYEIC